MAGSVEVADSSDGAKNQSMAEQMASNGPSDPAVPEKTQSQNESRPTNEEEEEEVKLEGEELVKAIRLQIEYYFSQQNLAADSYLVSQMNGDLFVPLSLVANFKNMKTLSMDLQLIADSVRDSDKVILDETPPTGVIIKPNIKASRNTLILRDISSETKVEDVKAIFEKLEGCPVPTQVRGDINDTWFVTFDSENDCVDAHMKTLGVMFNEKPIKARVKSENLLRTFYTPGEVPPPAGEGGVFPGQPGSPTYYGNPPIGFFPGGRGGWAHPGQMPPVGYGYPPYQEAYAPGFQQQQMQYGNRQNYGYKNNQKGAGASNSGAPAAGGNNAQRTGTDTGNRKNKKNNNGNNQNNNKAGARPAAAGTDAAPAAKPSKKAEAPQPLPLKSQSEFPALPGAKSKKDGEDGTSADVESSDANDTREEKENEKLQEKVSIEHPSGNSDGVSDPTDKDGKAKKAGAVKTKAWGAGMQKNEKKGAWGTAPVPEAVVPTPAPEEPKPAPTPAPASKPAPAPAAAAPTPTPAPTEPSKPFSYASAAAKAASK